MNPGGGLITMINSRLTDTAFRDQIRAMHANQTPLLDMVTQLGLANDMTPAVREVVERLGANLDRAGVDYALTGAAGASLLAPFVTAVPVTEVWVAATAAPEELLRGAGVDPVTDGQNVVFLQEKDDTPLAFREQAKGVWIANRFRLFADLRRDPRRGREQSDHLRQEVIGF